MPATRVVKSDNAHRSPIWMLLLRLSSASAVVAWVMQLFLADVILSGLLPISALLPSQCYNLSSHVAASVWSGVQWIFTRVNGARITVSGAEKLPKEESAIIISNHVEWTDFYMIQELALRSGMLGRCRWFAKQQLRWVPFLGWGLWAMGMPLVSRRWMTDQKEMQRVFQGPLLRRWPIWLISFSEATRFTPAKRLEAEAWCKQNNRNLGMHLLYPRSKGFIASVQKLRHAPQIKAVYDVTVAYAKRQGEGYAFQRPPTFSQSLLTPRLNDDYRFHVHVDRHLLEDMPREDEELARWLEDRWVEKGERLEELNQALLKGVPWDVVTLK